MLLRGPENLQFPEFRERFPWWGADLQTLRNTIRGGAPLLSTYPSQQLRFACTDGSGDVLLGTFSAPDTPTAKPLVILIHGLTGSEDSTHIVTSAAYFLGKGHPVLRLNQRGAGPSRATCRGHYHAGRSDDVAAVLNGLPSALTNAGVFLIAMSLGGNVLLKFLADYPRFPAILGAVAVSPPIDLAAAQHRIMQRRNWVYHRYLLKKMKNSADWSDLISQMSPDTIRNIRTIYEFDDRIVAPANDFDGAPDYYRRSSALDLLDTIDTPTLIIHPRNDPWVPTGPLEARAWDVHAPGHRHVSVLMPESGGHIGCHGVGARVPWHNLCADVFFSSLF